MTDKRWPILDLDEGATEAEVRRAYAKRLREQGPEADVASFQALRAEFEAALAAARSGSSLSVGTNATMHAVVRRRMAIETFVPVRDPQPVNDEEPPQLRDAPRVPERPSRAVEEIARFLGDGDLVQACDRFDLARASSEIDLRTESEIELELARSWLTNTTLDAAALTAIVRRYRWDDAVSDFSLGSQIVARLQAEAVPAPKPGERFIGKWNWGAFCLTPFWLAAHGLARRGIRIFVLGAILFVVPLGFIGLLWIAIDNGRTGNALAVKHRKFADEEQFVAVQNAWRNWGLSLCIGLPLCLTIGVMWLVEVHR
jgi:hypothetical protein